MNTLTTSDDGKTLTTVWKTISENGKESGGRFESERVGGAPAGSNKVAGEWRPVKTNTSEDVITVTYKATADGLAMSDPTGDSFTAKFDEKKYPFKGDLGVTAVSLKKIDENTIDETDIRKSKVITVARMTVDRDGKVMRITVDDKLRKAEISWTADKLYVDSEINEGRRSRVAGVKENSGAASKDQHMMEEVNEQRESQGNRIGKLRAGNRAKPVMAGPGARLEIVV